MADRQINKANEVLRELDAVFPGGDGIHPQFQWIRSENLTSLIPQFTPDGNPVMEYRCNCGTDVAVHAPECRGITVAKAKLVRVSTFGLGGPYGAYSRCPWALCVWQAPPTKGEWIDMFGTDEDYPSEGRYVPVHRGQVCVVIPPGTRSEWFANISRKVVGMMREHAESWRAELRRDIEQSHKLQIPIEDEYGNVIREPDKDAPYWKVKERLAEKMRHYNPTGTVGYTKEIVNA